MTHSALPLARNFNGWLGLELSLTKQVFATNIEIEKELWNAIEYYSEIHDIGMDLIRRKGLVPASQQQTLLDRFRAFVRQAKSYYSSAKALHYRSSSLLYYYSFLNLAKAYLAIKSPTLILNRTLNHGLGYRTNTSNNDFLLENVYVKDGIFPHMFQLEAGTTIPLSTRASASLLNVTTLLGFPSDIKYQYETAGFGQNKIIYCVAAIVTDRNTQQAWSLIGIPSFSMLETYPQLKTQFLNTYQEVSILNNFSREIFGFSGFMHSYYRFFQDITPENWIGASIIPTFQLLDKLKNALCPHLSVHYFDDKAAFEIILPYNANLLPMNEMLAIYVCMFYLSSLVRYRPDFLEDLISLKPSWLIESFVNSTPETFLRMMVSKIIEKDLVYRRR